MKKLRHRYTVQKHSVQRDMVFVAIASALALATPVLGSDADARIVGTYIEARTADVYTGPCFANGEVNLSGREAVMAWKVTEGQWRGVDLAGLAVVAVIKAKSTLGDPFGEPDPSAVLVTDEHAAPAQHWALIGLARSLSSGLLNRVVAIERAPVQMEVLGPGAGSLEVGDLARVRTRALNHSDHLCGNEEIYYPPLGSGLEAQPGVTLEHESSGRHLGSSWKSPGKRSAFVGTFVRP